MEPWHKRASSGLRLAVEPERQPPRGGRTNGAPHPPAQRVVFTRTRAIGLSEDDLRARRIVTAHDDGPFAAAYKLLRTRVLQRLREAGFNFFGVTSPGAGEGKTLTAINLAISIAMELNQTALLLDLDLRGPGLCATLGIDRCPGLAEHLLDGASLEDVLLNPGLGRLALLPAGRRVAASAELLGSAQMAALIAELKGRYPDRILIADLPPLLDAADALAFAPRLETALLVIESGRTTSEAVERALHLLGGLPLIGTVLNKA